MDNDIVSFEHINVNKINPHSQFVELTHTMEALEKMVAGFFIINETKWDTTCPKFSKKIRQTIKARDAYVKV